MKVPVLQFCLVLASLFACSIAGLSNNELINLVKNQGRNKVININDENYQHILSGERDYHLILLLSSTAPQINCALCNEFKPDYEIVANSWFQDHPNGLSELELEDDEDSKVPKKNIYFLYSEFMDSRNLFQLFQLNNIPKVFYFPPSTNPGRNNFLQEFVEYQFYQGTHKDLLISWLSDITGHKFNIYIPPNYTRVATNAFVTFTALMLIKRFNKQIYQIFASRLLWSGISLISVLLLTSGYMFNQIRGVPYVREHQNGKVDYFVPGQQNQLGIETQIMSFVYGVLSLLIVILLKKVPEIKNSQIKFLAVVIVSTLIFVFYSLLLSIFGIKGMGYPYKFINFF